MIKAEHMLIFATLVAITSGSKMKRPDLFSSRIHHYPYRLLVTLLFTLLTLHDNIIAAADTRAPLSPVVGYLKLRTYSNTALALPPLHTAHVPYPSFSLGQNTSAGGPCSAYLSGTIIFPSPGIYNLTCNFKHTTTGWAWIDGHQICNDNNTYHLSSGNYDNPLWIRRERNDTGDTGGERTRSMPLRVKIMYNGDCGTNRPSFDMNWDRIDAEKVVDDDKADTAPPTVLIPELPPAEKQRDDLQTSLAQGWGTWLHPNLLSIVKLPEGIVLTPHICRISTGACITAAIPDGRFRDYKASVRVDYHAWNRSYTQYYVGPGGRKEDLTSFVNANVSVEMGAHGRNNQELNLLLTPVSCDGGADCTDYEVRLQGRYAWYRAGVVNTTAAGKSLIYASAGLGVVNVTTVIATAYSYGDDAVVIPLGKAGDAVCASTSDQTTKNIRIQLDIAKAKELERLHDTFGPKAEVAKAIQAAVMWTYIYNPVENGPILPVSRGWGKNLKRGKSIDWIYVVFEWDCFFASLLAGLGNRDIAFSSLFQVIKSQSTAGFIPNYYVGGGSTEDRTEPPVGSKVVLELYRKFSEDWMVEVVFDDLLDWHEWFLRRRILKPAGLIALGSFNEQRKWTGQGDPGNSMQGARWESGLDNSPMYDGDFFDDTNSHLMQLYDVGMSSMFVQEAYSLAELADAIGRPEGPMLRSRGKIMADKIRRHLWDDSVGIYVNKFPNKTFYRRISPTSIYPMMANVPSDSQAATIVHEWLLNSSRFCIAPGGDFQDNHDDCYWGLPSISADDPAYLKKGVWNYWRGFVWGPMAMLTYWSLQSYDHVPNVRQGRRALCKQMEALMMSQWDANRHICENYNPHKTADTSGGDCSGTEFYHWGALTGLVGMMEDGAWFREIMQPSTRIS